MVKCYFCGEKATTKKDDRPMCEFCAKMYERLLKHTVDHRLARKKERKYRKLPL